MSDKRPSIGRLLKDAARRLEETGIETPRLDAELLLAHALGLDRTAIFLHLDDPLSPDAEKAFQEMLARRLFREPIAYITGKRWFHEILLAVSKDVIIPRPETELLVDLAMDRLEKTGAGNPRFLDLATGSGAIALAVAYSHKTAQITATDISEAALKVAQNNAQKLGLEHRIQWLQSDLFAAFDDNMIFDVIAANLPYIPTADIKNLHPDVKHYEPHLGLDGGTLGTSLIYKIIQAAPQRLSPEGFLILEIGIGQAQAVSQMAPPGLLHRNTFKDYCNIERIIEFQRASA